MGSLGGFVGSAGRRPVARSYGPGAGAGARARSRGLERARRPAPHRPSTAAEAAAQAAAAAASSAQRHRAQKLRGPPSPARPTINHNKSRTCPSAAWGRGRSRAHGGLAWPGQARPGPRWMPRRHQKGRPRDRYHGCMSSTTSPSPFPCAKRRCKIDWEATVAPPPKPPPKPRGLASSSTTASQQDWTDCRRRRRRRSTGRGRDKVPAPHCRRALPVTRPGRQAGRQTDRQTDRQSDSQTDRQEGTLQLHARAVFRSPFQKGRGSRAPRPMLWHAMPWRAYARIRIDVLRPAAPLLATADGKKDLKRQGVVSPLSPLSVWFCQGRALASAAGSDYVSQGSARSCDERATCLGVRRPGHEVSTSTFTVGRLVGSRGSSRGQATSKASVLCRPHGRPACQDRVCLEQPIVIDRARVSGSPSPSLSLSLSLSPLGRGRGPQLVPTARGTTAEAAAAVFVPCCACIGRHGGGRTALGAHIVLQTFGSTPRPAARRRRPVLSCCVLCALALQPSSSLALPPPSPSPSSSSPPRHVRSPWGSPPLPRPAQMAAPSMRAVGLPRQGSLAGASLQWPGPFRLGAVLRLGGAREAFYCSPPRLQVAPPGCSSMFLHVPPCSLHVPPCPRRALPRPARAPLRVRRRSPSIPRQEFPCPRQTLLSATASPSATDRAAPPNAASD